MMLQPVQKASNRVLKITLITSNAVMRTGLNTTLRAHPCISIIDDATVSAHAVDTIVREKPQVVIVDLELSDTDPLKLIRALRMAAKGSPILVLSSLNNAKTALKALAAGAEGVVLKIQPPAVLFAAIESVCGLVPRPSGDQLMPSVGSNDQTHQGFIESLTSREREVIQLIAKGFRNKEVANRLCISETTIRHHLTAIFSKLHISSRQQLLIMAHQQGLVEFSDPRGKHSKLPSIHA
jgi:DNA-binding NarL/FixJ family response regulator